MNQLRWELIRLWEALFLPLHSGVRLRQPTGVDVLAAALGASHLVVSRVLELAAPKSAWFSPLPASMRSINRPSTGTANARCSLQPLNAGPNHHCLSNCASIVPNQARATFWQGRLNRKGLEELSAPRGVGDWTE